MPNEVKLLPCRECGSDLLTEREIDAIYDALPKRSLDKEPYYSRTAIRLIGNAVLATRPTIVTDEVVGQVAISIKDALVSKDGPIKYSVGTASAVPPLINPDGPEAAALIRELVAVLGECQDKLWVIHFGLRDKAEREAAINACNAATAVFDRIRAKATSND